MLLCCSSFLSAASGVSFVAEQVHVFTLISHFVPIFGLCVVKCAVFVLYLLIAGTAVALFAELFAYQDIKTNFNILLDILFQKFTDMQSWIYIFLINVCTERNICILKLKYA